MPARERTYRVVNQRPYPVELHVAAEAVVLGPFEQADVHTLTAQVDELARRGLVVIEPADAAPAAPEPAASAKPAVQKSAPKQAAAKKPAAQKSATKKSAAQRSVAPKAAPAAPSTRRQPSRRGGK